MSLKIGHDENSLVVRIVTLKTHNEETLAEMAFMGRPSPVDFVPKTEEFVEFHEDYITVGIKAEKIDTAAIYQAFRLLAENLGKGQEH